MARINISKEIILSVANRDNSKFVDNIDEKVNNLFSAVIEKLSESISYITPDSVYLQPINELFSGAMVDNSSFVYLLGIDNAQLEMNTQKHSEFLKNLKDRFKAAWENRRFFKKKKKKKRKKKGEETNEPEDIISNVKFDPSKYDIYSLARDLQDTLILYLSETSICYLKDNYLTIVGRDDFGANTQIIVQVVNYSESLFKQFKSRRKGFTEIDINARFNALETKIDEVGENYIKVLKVLNLLYFNANKTFPNQVFMESILSYCPNNLFEGKDMYDIFVKIINFLYYKPLKEIKSVNNPSKSVLDDEVCGGNIMGYKKMLNVIASKDEK